MVEWVIWIRILSRIMFLTVITAGALIPHRGRKPNTHSAPKTNAQVTNPSSLKVVYPTKKESLCSRADKDMEELPGKGTEDHTR
jgi:hypothetical protein